MNITTESMPTKAGLLSRLWPKKQPMTSGLPTVSDPEPRMPVFTRNFEKLSENVEPKAKASEAKLLPGVGVLRIVLRAGPKTVGELATELGLSSVQASRLISRAAAEGHVTKRKQGRFVIVSVVPVEKLRRKRK